MANRSEHDSITGTLLLGLFSGAVCGVIAGLLLAPRSGKETRRHLRQFGRKTEEDVQAKAETLRHELEVNIEEGKRYLAKQRAVIAEAFEAGREAFRKEAARSKETRYL